jgi:hypothetical protein
VKEQNPTTHRLKSRVVVVCSVLVMSTVAMKSQVDPWPHSHDSVSFHDGGTKCGFSLVSSAWSNANALSARAKEDLAQALQRPSLQKSILVGFFRIHYDTVGENTPALLDSLKHPIVGTFDAYADSVAEIANYVRWFETETLGYPSPPIDNGMGGGNEYDIYVVNRPANRSDTYGVVEWEVPIINKPNGGTWTNSMQIHNDFTFVSPPENRGLPAMRVTLAHEFHHAIQIGNYGLWFGHEYFYELTSTWLEDVVYTDVNDYYNYLPRYFAHPGDPFTKADGVIEYSKCIWGHFVAKRFGRGAMRRAWEEVQNVFPLQAMDNALRDVSPPSSFRQAFSEWTKWNFFTNTRADTVLYYPEGRWYPRVVQTAVEFSPPAGAIEGSLACLASKYYQVFSGEKSFALALANINFDAGLVNSTTLFPYRYLLNVQPVDNSYRLMTDGVYAKLDVTDRTNWYDWSLGSSVSAGVPFPNPFFVDGRNQLSIAVSSPTQVEGTLSVFSSSMDLVFSASLRTSTHFSGQQVFVWNGKTNNGEIVHTGVYLFALEVQDKTLRGKIAVVKK